MGPRARIATDDGGGIDQAASNQLVSQVRVNNPSRPIRAEDPRARPRVDRQAKVVVMIAAKVVAMIVVMIVAVVVVVEAAVVVGPTEVTVTTAASSR